MQLLAQARADVVGRLVRHGDFAALHEQSDVGELAKELQSLQPHPRIRVFGLLHQLVGHQMAYLHHIFDHFVAKILQNLLCEQQGGGRKGRNLLGGYRFGRLQRVRSVGQSQIGRNFLVFVVWEHVQTRSGQQRGGVCSGRKALFEAQIGVFSPKRHVFFRREVQGHGFPRSVMFRDYIV